MNNLSNTPTNEDLTNWDRDHNLHPWASAKGLGSDEYMRVNSAKGIYMWDSEGKKFIDGLGGMWCTQIGYGRQDMADVISAQVMQMPYASPWSFTTTNSVFSSV